MVSVTSSVSKTYSGSSALQLLQSVSIDTNDGKDKISAGLWLTPSGNSSAALDTLIRILLDAKGNAELEIKAGGAMATAKTADGDDKITIEAGGAFGIDSGSGNDVINIIASGIRAAKDSDLPTIFSVDSGSGDDRIDIDAGGDVVNIDGGEGNDAITITRSSGSYSRFYGIGNVDAGAGDDTVRLTSDTTIMGVDGGTGHDELEIKSENIVRDVDGSDGNDAISVEANQAWGISGGAGDDTLVINAESAGAEGGDGNDTLQIKARGIFSAEGGDGNDTLIINAVNANNIDGGHGDDIIVVNAENRINGVSGGRGNDHITLTSAADTAAVFNYAKGDGNDVIVANSPLEIRSFSSDGTQQLDMRDASISFDGDTLVIGFGGTRDTITVKFGGRMAEGGDIHLVYEKFSKSLLIADDRMMEEMARREAQLPKPQGPAVLTLQR